MDRQPCNFSICNNANNQLYRHKARTFQPQMHPGRGILGLDSANIPGDKCFILNKFLTSTMPHHQAEPQQAGYANLPGDEPQESFIYHQHRHPHPLQHAPRHAPHHQHVHTRSQSHSNYYHTMGHYPGNDYYYNLPTRQTAIAANNLGRSPQQIHDPPLRSQPMHTHGKLDPLKVMEVCNEISDRPIDSSPPIPKSRDYTVAFMRDGNLYRFGFPQKRYITGSYRDPVKNIALSKDQLVTVLGPSQGDRSKFTVCFSSCAGCCDPIQLDIQHQLTKMPLHWNQ